MNTILLILGILLLIRKKQNVKSLFKSKEIKYEAFIKAMNEFKTQCSNETTYKVCTVLVASIICFTQGIFYLLSAIFLKQFAFTIISIFLVIDTVKTFFNFLNCLTDISKVKAKNFMFSFLSLLVDLFYIIYVFYHIYLTY